MKEFDKQKRKGFSYTVSDEQIRKWRALSAEQKLEWLEQANAFINQALTPKRRAIMEKFRKGEI
jgi:hypothetical protein